MNQLWINGTEHERIARKNTLINHPDCSGCGAPAGEFHVPGCEIENCPDCFRPRANCAHRYEWSFVPPMAQPPADPPMAQPAPAMAPAQSVMLLGLTDDAAHLVAHDQIPVALRNILAGYALAGLDTNRQQVALQDLAAGRITTPGALRNRCKALAKAQAAESAMAFTWGA